MTSAADKRKKKLSNEAVYCLLEIQASARRTQDDWLTAAMRRADRRFDDITLAYLARVDKSLDKIVWLAKLALEGGSLTELEAELESEWAARQE